MTNRHWRPRLTPPASYSALGVPAVPLITMNVMNAFGERQHPEKFIPLLIGKLQAGEKVREHRACYATRRRHSPAINPNI